MYRYASGEQQISDTPDLARIFAGHSADTDFTLHPPGCRHQASSKPILACGETWSTVLVGGLGAVEQSILDIEAAADSLSNTVRIDMPGMHLGPHSLVLPCEVCMRHSVVSWEWYKEVQDKSVACTEHVRGWHGTSAAPSGPLPPSLHPRLHLTQSLSCATEYYLFIACTYSLLETPRFSLLHQHAQRPYALFEEGVGGHVTASAYEGGAGGHDTSSSGEED
jgi:hypothetical protein